MQKLHSEGLLENIDEESFDKCESCISGKMTKKPFNKNIERATDLLGLIHTDVCGPLRHVSRKGASYFLTFTDDFSRYGYVFLLKHKHEVFETFKVFKAEVELQLGKKIKALRSDRGGEYLSQEFKDYLSMEIFLKEISYLKKFSGRDYDLEDDHMDTLPSENTSEIPVKPESLGPPSEFIPVRRSERTTCAPNHLCLNMKVEDDEVGDLGEPANYKTVMLDPDKVIWQGAMDEEIKSIKVNKVWIVVDRPPNAKVVRNKWLYKKKTDMDGKVHTYKARLVAQGCTQTFRIDYQETFSPVADIRAIRILIAIAAYYDYEIWQMDVKTAFLNGRLDMEQPEGYVDPKYPNGVCKLQRAIYGLKQASRQWNKRFDEESKRFF
uniref:Retrotransposon protein, putative, Ty1-copia subclass n=1 Tax=Tanacetum cinerariifolium TaxID=118510 RepID=A0A6L2NKN2_TANCI|nr:retrotransposon protein, putative, Ty1-copia subclass [Tanacetum cinerariifolium]